MHPFVNEPVVPVRIISRAFPPTGTAALGRSRAVLSRRGPSVDDVRD